MDYKQSMYNRLMTISFFIAVILLIAMIVFGIVEYRQSELEMHKKIPLLFEQSISEEVKLKMEGEYVYVSFTNDPAETKKVRNQTLITEDTTIIKEVEIDNDYDKHFIKSSQSYLLYKKRLQPDTLQQIFKSRLDKDGIKAHPVVLIKHEEFSWMSDDTTLYRIKYHTPIIKGGVLEEITYEALLNYGPFTVIRLMPKKILSLLFVFAAVVLIFSYYMFLKKSEIKPDKIMKKGYNYYIGETVFNTLKNELIKGEKVINVPKQLVDILLMFLESKEYAVKKDDMKKRYWNKSDTADKSMISAANKLRTLLKDMGCTFTITTKKSAEHYTLKYSDDVDPNEE